MVITYCSDNFEMYRDTELLCHVLNNVVAPVYFKKQTHRKRDQIVVTRGGKRKVSELDESYSKGTNFQLYDK